MRYPKRDKVFISYSHADRRWLQRLQVFLKPLSREGKVDWWADTIIKPGSNWREEITKALDSAKVAVLLVSADFLASDFIAEVELPALLKAAETDGAIILSVIVSPSRFSDDERLSQFQAVNDPSRPLITMRTAERERLWVTVTKRIEAALAETPNDPQHASSTEPSLAPLDSIPAVGVFINRREHINAIQTILEDEARRFVIVQGLPGIGKTTLAAKLVEAFREQFKAVLWITCRPDHASPDVLFAKLHAFLEENGDPSLRGLWNDPRPDLLETKMSRLIRALGANRYLLIVDEFQNWLAADFQLKNAEVRQVLGRILRSAHQSKVVLISEQRPLFDPLTIPLPVGSSLERTLLGLSKPDAIQLLHVTGFEIEDEALLDRIIEHCDGNPYMLQIFSYQVRGLHRDPEELLASGDPGFDGLLQAAISDLSRDSHSALEQLSILRLPLSRGQLRELGLRFDKVIGPLLARFLVIEDAQTRKIGMSTVVRNFVNGTLSKRRRRDLHKQAAAFYVKQRGDRVPQSYEELNLALEEGYHRFQYGDGEVGARAIMSIVPLLIDWGYIELAEQNILIARENTQDMELKAQCLWLLGSIDDLRVDYPGALEHFNHALRLYESVKNYGGIARTLFRTGRIHNALNQFGRADEYFHQCIHVCEEQGVTDGWAGALLGLGWSLQEQSDDGEKALELYKQCLERAEQLNDFETLISAHRQIGFSLWTERRQKDEAREHYEQALRISKTHSLVKEIGAIHTEMGYLYDEWGENEKAQQSCNQAIEIYKELGNDYGLGSVYCNLGKVFESRQDLEAAVTWYNQSRNIFASIANSGGQAYACLRLGKVLRQQGKLTKAEDALLEAARLCQDHDLKETCADVKEQLRELRLSQG